MDAYFPAPLSDELLYSLMARYKAFLPYSNSHVSQSKFGFEGALSSPSFIGENASTFYQQHSEFWRSEHTFIRTMTGCNLLYPFLPNSLQSQFYKALQGYSGGVIPLLRQYLYFPNHNFRSLKYCPKCIQQDVEQYGVAYWHRSHCVWFVTACWQHGCMLNDVQKKSRFELPPQEKNLQGGAATATELCIANLVHELLVGALPWRVSLSSLYYCYQHLVMSKGGKLKRFADQIQAELTELYSPDLLKTLQVRDSFNGAGKRCWVYDVLNTQRLVHIPEHLLVVSLLFGSISNLRQVWSTLSDKSGSSVES